MLLNYLLLLCCVSLGGTLLWGLYKLLKTSLTGCSYGFWYTALRCLLVFFLLPVFSLAAFLLKEGIGEVLKQPIESPDIDYILFGQLGWNGLNTRYSHTAFAVIYHALFIIWLCGFLFQLIRSLWACRLLHRLFLLDAIPCYEKSALINFSEICTQLRIHQPVSLYCSEALETPILNCFWKPRLYLRPIDLQNPSQLRLIFLHELTHLKRRDLWFKAFASMISLIHWFNPFLQSMIRHFYDTCELSCDEKTLQYLNHSERLQYIQLIGLTQSSFLSGFHTVALRDSNQHIILRRIQAMANQKSIRKTHIILASVVLSLAAPLSTAAAAAVTAHSGVFLEIMLDQINTTEASMNPEYISGTEEIEHFSIEHGGKLHLIQPRGSATVNINLSKSGASTDFGSYDLKENDLVDVSLIAANDSDRFKVSLVDSSGSAVSVSSAGNRLMHSFKVAHDGIYFVRITSTTKKSINITGVINV